MSDSRDPTAASGTTTTPVTTMAAPLFAIALPPRTTVTFLLSALHGLRSMALPANAQSTTFLPETSQVLFHTLLTQWCKQYQGQPLTAGNGPALPVAGELQILALGAIPVARTLLLVPHVLAHLLCLHSRERGRDAALMRGFKLPSWTEDTPLSSQHINFPWSAHFMDTQSHWPSPEWQSWNAPPRDFLPL